MNLDKAFSTLNFWINKYLGSYYSIEELTDLVNNGQMSYYTDIKPKYATSNLIKEILAPFREEYEFNPSKTVSGIISVPSNSNYLDLLDIQIEFQISNRTVYTPVVMVNEDERAYRLNSQISPVTATSPIGEILKPRFFRIYPLGGYTGRVTYFRKPADVVYGYSVISGRVIVYNEATSTQLEWRQSEIIPILLKGLESIGINLSAVDIEQFAQKQTEQNYLGVNKL
jgi:hypothetical protein